MKIVKCNLSTLMGKKKIKSIHQLSKETKIRHEALSKLYKEDQNYMPSFDTVIRLCEFFKCDFTDLLQYEPKKAGQAQEVISK